MPLDYSTAQFEKFVNQLDLDIPPGWTCVVPDNKYIIKQNIDKYLKFEDIMKSHMHTYIHT